MKKLNGIEVKEVLLGFVNNEELELDNDVIIDLENEINSLSDGLILFEDLCNVCLRLGDEMGLEYGGDVEIIESVLYELGLEEDEVLELVDGYVNN
jgi:hypothetical protein